MRTKIYLLVMVLILAFAPVSFAGDGKAPRQQLNNEQQARLDQIIRRVDEIRAMDRSQLSRSDRKALKNELKQLKQEARVMKGGVYLSVGAIIIIILLLILLL